MNGGKTILAVEEAGFVEPDLLDLARGAGHDCVPAGPQGAWTLEPLT